MTVTQFLIGAAVLTALSVPGGIWAFQTYGIYRFPTGGEALHSIGPAAVRMARFTSEDGIPIHAWIADPAGDRPVILGFSGNSAGIGDAMRRLTPLVEAGYGLVMMEYRGSGATPGHPSELAFARDARALYDQLDGLMGRTVPAERRVLHGFSLGAGVGSRLAADRPFAAVIFEAAPLRTCLYYQDRYFGIPFCRLMWAERYDIVDHVQKITAPKLFVHGTLDEALPVERAQLLYEAAPDPKRYVELPDGHHADLDRHGLLEAMEGFLAEQFGPR